MIRESVYMEMMRNCSKWNSRNEKERRGRYPVVDAQTGVAQRPNPYAHPTVADRFPPANATQVCTYASRPWKRRSSAPSSDATELKFFCQCNPTLNDAINAPPPSSDARMPGAESSYQLLPQTEQIMFGSGELKREARPTSFVEREYDEDGDDLSDDFGGGGSDEDDWGDRKRRVIPAPKPKPKGRPPSKARPAGAAGSSTSANQTPAEEKPFTCPHCGAKYKSRPGLNYHKAHVHAADFQEISREPTKTNEPHCTSFS